MSKLSITYIGDKQEKPDTVTNSRYVFPRLKPVEVEAELAYRLLKYASVWVLSEDAEDIIAAKEAKDAAIKEKLEEEAKQAQKKVIDENMMVIVGDDIIDIAKYSSKQLETLAVANDLIITTKVKPVAPYRKAIRDELRKLNGTPDTQE